MMTKKKISLIIVLNLLLFLPKSQIFSLENKITGEKNFFHEYNAFNNDGTINVIVEIPAGDNDKWELWKKDGSIRWEFQNNSFRKIKYLPYISNYGFVPQTLFSKEIGGDGDPIDVILLGERFERGSIIKGKILGLINMKDEGRLDSKIVAVNQNSFVFNSSILNNFDDLNVNYPGALEIIEIWFQNYKLNNKILINGYGSVNDAKNLINKSVDPYKLIKGFWENNKK
tara:strand:+ start:905 stop:1588 length:684 start_codon:yes stop_codon:yes gene_type:complete